MTAGDHHAYLKWPRLIAFNLNGALAIVACALSSRSLVNLNHDRALLASQVPGAKIHATDAVASSAIMVTAGGIASLYTAALSTAIVLRLHREETLTSIRVKEVLMALMGLFLLGAAIAATIIVVPRSARLSAPGIPEAVLKSLVASTGKSIAYKDSLVYPATIVTWFTFGATLVSFILAALASRHIKKHGSMNTLVGHKVSDQYEHGERMTEKNGNGSIEHRA